MKMTLLLEIEYEVDADDAVAIPAPEQLRENMSRAIQTSIPGILIFQEHEKPDGDFVGYVVLINGTQELPIPSINVGEAQ
jgi:hypothetical protein